MDSICQSIQSNIGSLFECENLEEHVRISTPYFFPDGNILDIYIREEQGRFVASDLGETLQWLRSQSISVKRTPRQNQLVSRIADHHRVSLHQGILSVDTDRPECLPEAFVRLAQSCLRIADLCFTFRGRSVVSTIDEVVDWLDDKGILFERNVTRIGNSGKQWPIDLAIAHDGTESLVQVLYTGSRSAAMGIVEHAVTGWFDLGGGVEAGDQFISLLDDNTDVWAPEHFNLLAKLSRIAKWSKPDEFLSLIYAHAA